MQDSIGRNLPYYFYMIVWKNLRKFGPKYSDLPTMIWNINILLRSLAVNVDGRVKRPIPLAYFLLTVLCGLCYAYTYQFSMLWFVFIRSSKEGDLVAAVVFGSLGTASQVSFSKLLYMLTNGSKLRFLVDQYLKTDDLTEPGSRFSRSITKVLRTVKIRAIIIWNCVIFNAVIYVLMPAFMSGKHLPEDLLVFYGLEPTFETPNFEISFAITTISVLFISYVTGTIAAFVIVVLGYSEAQLTALRNEMLNIWEDSVEDSVDFKINYICAFSENNIATLDSEIRHEINTSVRRRLIKIVQIHSRNVALIRNINDFFYIPKVMAFGSLAVSLITELLGGIENTYLQIPFTFTQVALDCFTGQKIMDVSVAFEKAVYYGKWENFDVDNRKIILLMLLNSQKTLAISAGGMVVLNFSSLMSIVKSVYSAYTTLRSVL